MFFSAKFGNTIPHSMCVALQPPLLVRCSIASIGNAVLYSKVSLILLYTALQTATIALNCSLPDGIRPAVKLDRLSPPLRSVDTLPPAKN